MRFAKLFSFLFVIVMMFSLTTSTSFAASSSKSVTSAGAMSLYLAPTANGDSNVITFNVSGLPASAVVSKVVIDANNISWGGSGAIVSTSLSIKNNTMGTYVTAPWGSGNTTEITTGLIGKPAAGMWSIYYNGTNVSTFYDAYKTYKNVKLIVYYNY